MQRLSDLLDDPAFQARLAALGDGPEHDCARCKDSGWVHFRGERFAEPCPKCAPAALLQSWRFDYLVTGIPRAQWDKAQWDQMADSVRAELNAWLLNPSPILVFTGRVGAGKSCAAVCAVRSLVALNRAALWTSAQRLLDRIRASFDAEPEERARVERFPLMVDVLALDDLGAEQETEWARARLLSLIDRRLETGQTTIITTNQHPRNSTMEERLRSRVFGARSATVIAVPGPDRRVTR